MLTRRQVLSGSLTTLGATALAGCTTGAGEPIATGAPEAAVPVTSTDWPVAYDHPGSSDGVIAPFLYRYPSPAPKTVPDPPGDGSTITAACQLNSPAPTPMGQNVAWQALNQSLGATLAVQFTPGGGWAAKLQTLLAGGDLPDLVQVTAVPRLPELLPRTFADLTEYLSGDRVNDYPNLALLGEAAWRNTRHGGRFWGVPQPRNRAGGAPYRVRADILDSLGLNPSPTNGTEFEELLRRLTDPGAKRWASAGVNGALTAFATMLGAPNRWEDRDGHLVSEYESEEYLSAIDRIRTLWSEGVFHPEAFTSNNLMSLFDNGQTVMEYGSFDALPRRALRIAGDPRYRAGFVVLPRYEGGGPAQGRLDSGYYGMTAIPKDTSPERIRLLLRILNWIAAPAGTAEFLLRQYGLEGKHHTIDGEGILQTTPAAGAEVVILGYLACARPVYVPPAPELRPGYDQFHDALVTQYAEPKDNPVNGFYSEQAASSTAWERRLADTRDEIIKGARPTSTWGETVATWRSEVGDRIRDEYGQARAHG